MNWTDLDWSIRLVLIATPGLIWFFGMKVCEKLDTLIRLRDGTSPRK